MKQRLENVRAAVMNDSQSASLGSRATRSGVWIGGGFVIQRGLQFASNLILTRLLFPEAFGLMALCSVFLVGLGMFSDLGLKPAIIRDPRGNEPDFLNTAWTIQVIRGFVLFICGCLLAYPISVIYDQPILVPLLAVLSITAAISGFTSIKMTTAERDLDFKSVTFIMIASQIVHILSMVILAYYWFSVWALAVGSIVSAFTSLVMGHVVLRGHQHRLKLDPSSAKSLVHFGKWIFLSTIVTFLGGEGLRAIQGGFVSPSEFGILAIAYTIAAIPIELATKLTTSVGLPALSAAHRDIPDSLQGIIRKFRKRVLTLSLILVAAVVLTSEVLVALLYDDRYHAAGSYVVAITLSNAVTLIFAGYFNALLALGKSKTYFSIMIFATIARILGVTAGFQIFGILGMIIGVGVANVATLFTVWIVIHKIRLLDLKLDFIALTSIIILVFIMT